MKVFLFLAGLALALAAPVLRAADASKFELKDGDRVAFIGDTFVEREQVGNYIETALTSRFPDRNITFRNLGYSGDTTSGSARGLCAGWAVFEGPEKAFQRLRKLVAEFKPTVLVINYGMTESFSGPDGIAEFTASYKKMLDALSADAGGTPRLVLMSPNYHEDLGRPLPDPTEHNKNLKLYADAIEGIAKERSCLYIDLFSLTKAAEAVPVKLTSNGIHLTPFGYWWTAQAIERSLGYGPRQWKVQLDADGKPEAATATNAKVAKVSFANGGASFVVEPATLPVPPIPSDTPLFTAHPGENPFHVGVISIAGLKPGMYHLKVDGQVIANGTAAEWNSGIAVKSLPAFAQTEDLRETIVAKNFDFFNYQRPDNDSYILAFRSREQGKNAAELPKFLPLMEEKEKQIAAMRVPKAITYTLEAK